LLEGEQSKTKLYKCLVELSHPLEDISLLNKLQGVGPLQIDQKTPIRVMHRRALLTRKKTIFSMKAHYISPRFFTLELLTQAGTYIKEFVHGDLGRTSPSLRFFFGDNVCELLLLDVMHVDLNFPPEISSQEQVLNNVPTLEEELREHMQSVEGIVISDTNSRTITHYQNKH